MRVFRSWVWWGRENVVMQGRSEGQRELLDAESVVGHLVTAGSVFAFLAEHRRALFPDEVFADLFPSGRGRPLVPADVMAAVIVLQTLHGLSDSETTQALTFDLRWKAAVGWPLTERAFHDTTLTVWRRRLLASSDPNRIFAAVQRVVAETGVLKGKTRRALDSTVLDDAVATQDTITQLIAAVRRVRRVVPGADAVVAEVTSAHDYDDPGKPVIAWNDKAARDALVDALVRDALAVLGGVGDPPVGAAADAVGLLGLVAGQDVELVAPDPDSEGPDGDGPDAVPRWRIAHRVAPDRVISVVDPQARHAHKTVHRRQDGFKAHLAIEPDTGLTTACTLSAASGANSSDATVGVGLLAGESTHLEVLADSAYGSGAARGAVGRGRAHRAHQADPAARPGARRVHRRRLHHRPHDRDGDLPGRGGPGDHRQRQRHLRCGLPRLSPAGAVHHRPQRPPPHGLRARTPDARRPATRRDRRVRPALPPATPHGRAFDRLARARRQPQAPLPRDRQERPVAAPPPRRAQPASDARAGPEPPAHRLANRLTKRDGGHPPPPPALTGP